MTDDEVASLSGGNLYHYMLDKDHFEWAKWANRMGKLGLDFEQEGILAVWFANAMCAVVDRQSADYIRARLDSEAEDEARFAALSAGHRGET